MSLQTGTEIARTHAAIIDPRKLQIVAFYVQGQLIENHPSVLFIEDIRCLLYTSDAADERSSVDLGGRRIITKKTQKKKHTNKKKTNEKTLALELVTTTCAMKV